MLSLGIAKTAKSSPLSPSRKLSELNLAQMRYGSNFLFAVLENVAAGYSSLPFQHRCVDALFTLEFGVPLEPGNNLLLG